MKKLKKKFKKWKKKKKMKKKLKKVCFRCFRLIDHRLFFQLNFTNKNLDHQVVEHMEFDECHGGYMRRGGMFGGLQMKLPEHCYEENDDGDDDEDGDDE